jgi:broad specificity phosphatase PhoE
LEHGQMSVFAIRHGETTWRLSGQHTGTTNNPSTENEHRLAARLRPVLARQTFAQVLASPLQRARDTCADAGLGDKTSDPDLMEWDYGDDEGIAAVAILARVDRAIERARAVDGALDQYRGAPAIKTWKAPLFE